MIAAAYTASMVLFFSALSSVESGGNDAAIGDAGRSIGRYQIGRAYWQDSGVPGTYAQVTNPSYARRVMLAYWRRYCPGALARRDFEILARVHNGGPRGAEKRATLGYWRRVVEKAEHTGA